MTSRKVSNAVWDPTWYRVRYALAVRCLQIATADRENKAGLVGWPKDMSAAQDGKWRQGFGPETQALLLGLFEDQRSVQSPSDEAIVMALSEAKGLLVTAATVLDDAGWHWVGRKPPRYLSWTKKRPLRRWRERPVASSVKLTRFLNDVVEPAAVILYCSAWLVQDDDAYYRLKAAVLGRVSADLRPVDRRGLVMGEEGGWAIEYLSTFLADQQIGTTRHARVEARLGRTQYRAPREPAPRVRYSLACLLSRLATEADRHDDEMARDSFVQSAAAQLEAALSDAQSGWRDRLARWARRDPDLSGLRDQNPGAFATIVAMWGPSERRQVARKKLDSTAVSSAAYVADAKVLELELADGSLYQYFDVPKGVYEELIEDASPGTVFNEKIRSKYAFIRL